MSFRGNTQENGRESADLQTANPSALDGADLLAISIRSVTKPPHLLFSTFVVPTSFKPDSCVQHERCNNSCSLSYDLSETGIRDAVLRAGSPHWADKPTSDNLSAGRVFSRSNVIALHAS